MKELLDSKYFRGVLIGLAACIILISVFAAGVAVGERKARHFAEWSNSYPRMFQPRGPAGGLFPHLPDAHGVFGKIISASDLELVVQGRDGVEQTVLVSTSTEIRLGRDRAYADDLRTGNTVGVFGAPNNQGQIEARLIRIMEDWKWR